MVNFKFFHLILLVFLHMPINSYCKDNKFLDAISSKFLQKYPKILTTSINDIPFEKVSDETQLSDCKIHFLHTGPSLASEGYVYYLCETTSKLGEQILFLAITGGFMGERIIFGPIFLEDAPSIGEKRTSQQIENKKRRSVIPPEIKGGQK